MKQWERKRERIKGKKEKTVENCLFIACFDSKPVAASPPRWRAFLVAYGGGASLMWPGKICEKSRVFFNIYGKSAFVIPLANANRQTHFRDLAIMFITFVGHSFHADGWLIFLILHLPLLPLLPVSLLILLASLVRSIGIRVLAFMFSYLASQLYCCIRDE